MATLPPIAKFDRSQAYSHVFIEYADYEKCIKYFDDYNIDYDEPNLLGRTILMSVCANGRSDLIGFVLDRTTAIDCATYTNLTTVLHLATMFDDNVILEEMVATAERKHKIQTIIDQANIHGDTALMMACVAKNVGAVQLLLEMGANLSATNANGLNALMCAARVGTTDPRPNAPSIDQKQERSARIVNILLANGADVNAVEKAAGNTALHFAVLSENVIAVESILANARDLDLTSRNKDGNTALDLSKQISTVASAQIKDLLKQKWAQNEIEDAQMRAKIEQELLELVANETTIANHTKTTARQNGKKKKKKTKKKAQVVEKTPTEVSGRISKSQDLDDDTTATLIAKLSVLHPASAEVQLQSNVIAIDSAVLEIDDQSGPWQRVVSKNRRDKKSRSGENVEALVKQKNRSFQRKLLNTRRTEKEIQSSSKSHTVPAEKAHSGHLEAASSTPTATAAHETLCSSQLYTSRKSSSSSSSTPEHSAVTLSKVADEATERDISYDMMNASFHRTFPVAAELEIGVEKFLIASSMSDYDLEFDNCLSISQVEVLQESHWQAYHYLNEKKIELTRGLEAQRVQAEFDLQKEFTHLS